MLGNDKQAEAGGPATEVFFSYSSIAPVKQQAIVVNPGTIRDVYVWTTDVSNSTGASGFTLAIEYEDDYMTLFAQSGDVNGIGETAWLGSTGRSASCVPEQGTPEPGRIVGLCTTLNDPPPFGATGDGKLGHFRINAQNFLHPPSPITFIPFEQGILGTKIVDTPVDPEDIQEIPITLVNASVVFLGCADNSSPGQKGTGDGIVDLPNDILGVVLRFGWTTANPAWHGAFDINHDGVVDLPNDILGTILQFQNQCLQT